MVECFTTVGWHLKANLLPRHTFRNSFCMQNPTKSSLFLPTFPFKMAQWSFQILNNDQMDGREVKVGWERACDTKSSRPCRPSPFMQIVDSMSRSIQIREKAFKRRWHSGPVPNPLICYDFWIQKEEAKKEVSTHVSFPQYISVNTS